MERHWTFAQKIAAGFAAVVLLGLAISAVAIYALRSVVASKDRVIEEDARRLIRLQALETNAERAAASTRGYLLSKDPQSQRNAEEATDALAASVEQVRDLAKSDEDRELAAAIAGESKAYLDASEAAIALRRGDATPEAVARFFDEQVLPLRRSLQQRIDAMVERGERALEHARERASASAASATSLVLGIAIGSVLLAMLVALLLSRALGRQIGTAIGQVQSSSAELQAAANQQATGSREQATAMNEITTTISELLATSRQIAESAQRVAQIAGQTASAAGAGEGTVERAHDSIGGIRRQVDQVVTHMLELGRKSQQIGSVVEIVSELAEQTNILAINATIEAAGAGETGKRFGVVADEIRKLADRVGGSTKEIRALIDDVRAAVNTTVMATETGSKAVDAGTRQFGDVAVSLKQIAGMVSTTTEAAREIELSTKQQSTAVEQVNIAIANVAQASKESEASSTQTLQTASQLATLSKDLLRLVRPQAQV